MILAEAEVNTALISLVLALTSLVLLIAAYVAAKIAALREDLAKTRHKIANDMQALPCVIERVAQAAKEERRKNDNPPF